MVNSNIAKVIILWADSVFVDSVIQTLSITLGVQRPLWVSQKDLAACNGPVCHTVSGQGLFCVWPEFCKEWKEDSLGSSMFKIVVMALLPKVQVLKPFQFV